MLADFRLKHFIYLLNIFKQTKCSVFMLSVESAGFRQSNPDRGRLISGCSFRLQPATNSLTGKKL